MTAGPFTGQVCLGWQHELLHAAPGLPPRRPVPPDPERLNPGWLAAQRREEKLLSRPARTAACGGLLLAAGVILLGWAGWLNPALTGLGAAACGGLAVTGLVSAWQGRQALKATVAAETRRVTAARAAQETDLFCAQEDHARRFRAWQSRQRAFSGQALWYPVVLPAHIDRIDLVGGTMAGWSALLTSVAVPRLASGDAITVIDLSDGAIAGDLVTLAGRLGLGPLVWVLPGDLARFDLGVGLPAPALADVLAASAAADRAAAGGGHDPAPDHALLSRLLEVLGDGARICQVTAGLRALAQVGDPRDDVRRGLLTPGQLERITGLFGRGAADRVVIERAWALEARLRVLDPLGTDPAPVPRSRLRVVAADPGGGAFGNGVLAAYVTVALTHLLRHARPGRPWRHTVCLAGAQALPGEVIERLAGACEATRTGLVVAYRSIPPQVAQRLGRGNAALAVMRLGNAADAKAASEQIGAQHRFVLSQLTDTVGASVTDTAGGSYTSTVGTADSVSVSLSRSQTSGRSRSRGHTSTGGPLAPRTGSGSVETSESVGTSDTGSVTDGINTSTSWGITTSRAIGRNESLGHTVQRSREFLVEPEELQRLPPSAVIVSYASGPQRHVVLADANPAIAALPTASMHSLDEARSRDEARRAAEERRPGEAWWPDETSRVGEDCRADEAWRTEEARRADGLVPGGPSDGSPSGPPAGKPAGRPAGRHAAEPVGWRSGSRRPPPNLGPPPEPPDWRTRRR